MTPELQAAKKLVIAVTLLAIPFLAGWVLQTRFNRHRHNSPASSGVLTQSAAVYGRRFTGNVDVVKLTNATVLRFGECSTVVFVSPDFERKLCDAYPEQCTNMNIWFEWMKLP